MSEETAIIGIKQIAKFYGWSESRTAQEMPKMKQAGCAKRLKVGRGHARRVRIMALPSLLERYWIENVESV